jgi:hypothetical protein
MAKYHITQKIYAIKKGDRKLCNEKFYNLYPSPKIVMLIFKKSEMHGTPIKYLKIYEIVGQKTKRNRESLRTKHGLKQ